MGCQPFIQFSNNVRPEPFAGLASFDCYGTTWLFSGSPGFARFDGPQLGFEGAFLRFVWTFLRFVQATRSFVLFELSGSFAATPDFPFFLLLYELDGRLWGQRLPVTIMSYGVPGQDVKLLI